MVTLKLDHALALITLKNTSQRNSLSLPVLQQLDNAISQATAEDIRAIVITGTADVFASGADLNELSQLSSDSALEFSKRGQDVFQRITDARPVTIAAMNGYCMGGGLDLALACDIRIASRNAKFSHPGPRRGIITGWGGTQRLPRLIGRTRALEMLMTAGVYSSEEALEMGLISGIGDPVLEMAMEIAEKIPAWTNVFRR